MLVRRGKRWDLYPHKVRYRQHGEESEQWALPSKEWWINFADKWDHTEIIEFTEIELDAAARARFEDIQDMPGDFADAYTDYVLNGSLPDKFPKNHPFMLIKAQQGNADTTEYLVDMDFRLSMVELGL